ncbi:MAG: hypothetical protein HY653_06700 [Acidobacteria bacterium]|nr:hypothetical protein [Acidobacteriota bacterium]
MFESVSARLLCLVLATGCAWGQAFHPGERLRYTMQMKLETRTQLAGLGENWGESSTPARREIYFTWLVEAVEVEPDGSVHLRAVVEDLTVAPVASWQRIESYRGKAVTYTRRPDGSLEDIQAPAEWLTNGKLPDWLRAWLTQAAGGGSSNLSQRKPGDSWEVEQHLNSPGLGALRLQRMFTYLRNETQQPRPCAAVLSQFKLSSAGAQERSLETQTRLVSRVWGVGESLNCYDLLSERLLDSTHTSREDILMEIERREEGRPPTQLILRVETTVESSLRLIE